jgi:hypothetical protein
MYTVALIIHSWLRWAALAAGVLAVRSLLGKKGDDAAIDRWGLAFMIALDVQLLLGLLLYFGLSPNTAAIMNDFGAAMRDPVARFWAVEHVGTMLAAVVLAHVGRVLGRKAPTPQSKRGRLLMCFVMALILMLAATPWPGMANGRPLFRM